MENDNFNDGYITIHRKVLDWEWFDEDNAFRLFTYCILKANYSDKKWKGITIERGSFVTSLGQLAKGLKMSTMQVRFLLNKLLLTKELTKETTSQYTIIKVVKYDEYQSSNKESNKPVTNQEQTSNKPVTTTNNNNNNNKTNKEKEYIYPTELEFRKCVYEKIVKAYGEKSWNEKVRGNVIAKYEAWSENDWVDGNGTKIKNWKAKINHSLKHFLQ